MIRVELLRVDGTDLFCPRFYCDACGERIERNAEGNYLWYHVAGDTDAHLVYVAHKGTCSRSLDETKATNEAPMSWELEDLPDRLKRNGEEAI